MVNYENTTVTLQFDGKHYTLDPIIDYVIDPRTGSFTIINIRYKEGTYCINVHSSNITSGGSSKSQSCPLPNRPHYRNTLPRKASRW